MIPWYRIPRLSLAKVWKVDFFPKLPDPDALNDMKSICIGSKMRSVGDPLMLTTLPRKLKAAYPHLKIYTYPRGFNPVVFWNNPDLDGISFLPTSLFGDDCNEGGGQFIQQKERYFGVPVSEKPKPEIYLQKSEISFAQRWLKNAPAHSQLKSREELPLLILHPFGKTRSEVMSPDHWESIVQLISPHFRVVQVGVTGHYSVKGCDYHFFTGRAPRFGRQLFALIAQADAFIGVDSGPMHVARSFGLKSLIYIDHVVSAEMHQTGFLYPDAEVTFTTEVTGLQAKAQLENFLAASS